MNVVVDMLFFWKSVEKFQIWCLEKLYIQLYPEFNAVSNTLAKKIQHKWKNLLWIVVLQFVLGQFNLSHSIFTHSADYNVTIILVKFALEDEAKSQKHHFFCPIFMLCNDLFAKF